MSKAIDLLIIGRGRVGRSLGRAFRRAQRSVRIWSGRAFMANPLPSLPPASVIWITVSDPHIEAVSRHLSSALGKAGFLPSIAHASGALPPSVLWACRERGAPIAAAHPCLSFGSARTPLKGGVFVLDGDPHAIDALSRLILDLEGKPIIKGVHGPRYHAALALAANGSGALAALASSALEAMGFTPPESRAILSGLLHSLALNIRRMGPAEALTGPIARGDVQTLARHIESLEGPDRNDYLAVSRLILRAALLRGLSQDAHSAIASLLEP